VAKALHYSTIIDKRTGLRKASSVLDVEDHPDRLPEAGSNLSANELVKLLGSREVKYGEVAPNILGSILFMRIPLFADALHVGFPFLINPLV
jgi:hypothetical protein